MNESRQMPVKRARLIQLFPGAEWIGSFPDEYIEVANDSRKVTSGALFVAIVGFETDGHLFLKKALDAGASTLMVQAGHLNNSPELLEPVKGASILVMQDTRRALSILASEFFGKPTFETRLHGVTGTKGKTTTVHLLGDIFTVAGLKPAVMGTLGVEFNGKLSESKLTTPGPIEFQGIIRSLVDQSASDVICEVSAHSGALARTASARFETVTYMNLSRDHGDHFSPEEYLDAKLAISLDAVKVNPHVSGIGNARDPHAEAFLEPIAKDRQFRFAAFEESETRISSRRIFTFK